MLETGRKKMLFSAISAGVMLLALAGCDSRRPQAVPAGPGRVELNQPSALPAALPAATGNSGSILRAPLLAARQQAGVVECDGRIYAIGGLRYNPVEFLKSVESYDPVADAWREETPMPEAHPGMVAAACDGELYVIGGSRGSHDPGIYADMHIYNPQTRQWRSGPPLPEPRQSLCAAALGGKIYVIGGQAAGAVYTRVDVYDTVRGTWSRGPDLQTPRYCAAAVAYRDSIMAFGGESKSRQNAALGNNPYALASVEVLKTGQRAWQAGPELPHACLGPAAAVADDRILLLGGCNEGGYNYCNNVFAGDGGSWQELSPLAGPRAHGGAAVADGRVFVVGGVNVPRAGQLDTVEEYLPAPE